MILTCPACNTHYQIADSALADPAGRDLRCAQCGHQWRYVLGSESSTEPPVLPAPAEPARAKPGPATAEPAPVVPPPSPPTPGRSPRVEAPAVPPQPVRPATARGARTGIGCLLVIVIIAVAIAAIVVDRNQIVAWWPPAGGLYRHVGLRPEPPGAGLEIAKVTPSRSGDSLMVEGDVANPTGSERTIPRLRVILRDSTGKELTSKIIDPPAAQLAAGAVSHFKTQFEHPSDAATGVAVTFSAQ